jgi:hypothetical protein
MSSLNARPVTALLGIIVVLLAALAFLSVKAFAASGLQPQFSSAATATGATFAIPPDSSSTWSLRVWSNGQLIGKSNGTTGVLSVPLPASQACHFQADVRMTRPGGSFQYITGRRVLSACCPPLPTASG